MNDYNNDKICAVIDKYIKENGRTDEVWTKDKLVEQVHANYPEIPSTSIMPWDLCYNRCNGKDNKMTKDFANWPHALERIDEGKYIFLGTNYPYTGIVYHKRNENDTTYIFGEWYRGVFQKYPTEIPENEYCKNERLFIEAVDEIITDETIEGNERLILAKARINHSFFRDRLLNRYNHCCLCGVSNQALLVASHIKPWSVSDNNEKVDVNNGLLLCPNHDKLFDSGLISFSEAGEILISEELDEINRIFMNVRLGMRIEVINENKKYLIYHQNKIYRK